jgi:hypothetical protein
VLRKNIIFVYFNNDLKGAIHIMNNTDLRPYVHEESMSWLATGDNIASDMLEERDKAIELVDNVLNDLTKLNNLMEQFCAIRGVRHELFVEDIFSSVSYHADDFNKHKQTITRKIDAKYWDTLFNASRITSLITTNKKEVLKQQLKKDAPPFEAEAVVATISEHMSNRFSTFVDSLIEFFESLPHDYKSNDRICLRKKIILSDCLNSSGWSCFGSDKDRVYDLERIFTILDGKDPSQIKSRDTAVRKIARAKRHGENEIELDYFSAKLFNNGNVHIIFSSKDLVDKFNDVLASHKSGELGFRSAHQ